MEVINETQRSKDYSEIANSYRPGHADYTLIKNMVFAIIAAADAHPVVKQSDVWQAVLWL